MAPPPSSVAALFVVRTAGQQAGGLPESSRGLSDLPRRSAAKAGATPPDRVPKSPADPGGVAELWHPSRMPKLEKPLPGVCAMPRPPATLCQPSGLGYVDTHHVPPSFSASSAYSAVNLNCCFKVELS